MEQNLSINSKLTKMTRENYLPLFDNQITTKPSAFMAKIKKRKLVKRNAESYVLNLSLLIVIGLLTPTVLLPLTFRFGVEKGRLFYYFIIGSFCALSVTAANISELAGKVSAVPVFVLPIAVIILFILSWLLSIRIYERKEFR